MDGTQTGSVNVAVGKTRSAARYKRPTKVWQDIVGGGGALPWLIGRMAQGWKKGPNLKVIRRSPRAYLHRFLYDTIAHDPDAFAYLVRQVGTTRVMPGSDSCFNLGYDRLVQVVARLRGISAADRQHLLGVNAGRLVRPARS